MNKFFNLIAIVILFAILGNLSACGQSGSLYLPPAKETTAKQGITKKIPIREARYSRNS